MYRTDRQTLTDTDRHSQTCRQTDMSTDRQTPLTRHVHSVDRHADTHRHADTQMRVG